MTEQKISSLLIYFFHICSTVWGSTEQKTVTGQFSRDCILPCFFPPGNDVVIYWKKNDKNVHSYYYQRDQLGSQDMDYRNRTLLFHEDISTGNASLKLSNLTFTDGGLYHCYVGTQQTKTEEDVVLHVRVFPYYALEYRKTDTERMLKCSAFLTYPVPHINWTQGNTLIQQTDPEETRVGILYTVRSVQNIANTSASYQCHIYLADEEWTAEWKMEEQLSSVEGNSTAIPCEYIDYTSSHTEGFSVVWTINRNAVISVLASFNGTSHSYQPRAQINQADFSLMLSNLTANDGGEYLCNISTPRYTKLIVRTLHVESSNNSDTTWKIVVGVMIPVAVIGACGYCYFKNCKKRREVI
ncbi:HERV-H LTR-associating protein 2 isoform X1 [Apteryx mantelli]|uniref:HERV-H LTR-associating protein 2 isoform X1 n=1 Tax=Apteryx mantelli TaxID=2696672 RepID=A0A8B7J6D7_9AVES|nr:PREDICTED: HERV-H LTR-associating protein 2 isoform X1 [Apteryx mantelli mantelli]XP_025914179.1 HERV-H LTR-associating protein 2 isoform X2 [Apteryx rowi]